MEKFHYLNWIYLVSVQSGLLCWCETKTDYSVLVDILVDGAGPGGRAVYGIGVKWL